MPADSKLVSDLRAQSSRLAAHSVAHVCSGAFWDERFGERGRRHIEQDSAHHVDTLASALALEAVSVLEDYARWLQHVLTVRGMCSRHVEDHFESLSTAIRRDIDNSRQAVEYLGAATHALTYKGVSPRAMQETFDPLVQGAMDIVEPNNVTWFRTSSSLDHRRATRDVVYLLSYCIDAVALGHPDLFIAYADWIDGYYKRRGRPDRYRAALLAGIAGSASILPVGIRDDLRAVILSV